MVAVVGATGFVGSATSQALVRRGAHVVPISAPRLGSLTQAQVLGGIDAYNEAVSELAEALRGVQAVVNAAGVADATSTNANVLNSANGILPGVVAAAAVRAGVDRYVHVSSAAVQGRRPTLDASRVTAPYSAYSRSKELGEQMAIDNGPLCTVIYRPPGVHGRDRRVTRTIARVARSRLSSVARPGDANTPQALIEKVADAVAFLALTNRVPPIIVNHPSEGVTTSELLTALGGHAPRQVPRWLARSVTTTLRSTGRIHSGLAANSRRLEMLWFGQDQAPSWLTEMGWEPPADKQEWHTIGVLSTGTVTGPSRARRILVISTVPEQLRVQYQHHFQLYQDLDFSVTVACSGDATAFVPAGTRVHRLPLSRGLNPVSLIRATLKLLAICLRERPDVVIYGSPVAAISGSLASRFTVPTRVFVVHGLREETLSGVKHGLVIAISALTARLSTYVVFNSDSTRSRAKYVSRGTKPVVLTAPGFIGVDTQSIRSAARGSRKSLLGGISWDTECAVIGYTGRLALDKGIEDLVRAFIKLHRRENRIRLLLVGGLDTADPITDETWNTILNDPNIHCTGQIDNPFAWYGAMDVFCLPSRREGMPTVLLEAAAAGVPLVGYPSTGIVDVINRETGWLTPRADDNALCTVLPALLTRQDINEVLQRAQAARDLVESRFSIQPVMDWWREFYSASTLNQS